jgi:acetyl esterase
MFGFLHKSKRLAIIGCALVMMAGAVLAQENGGSANASKEATSSSATLSQSKPAGKKAPNVQNSGLSQRAIDRIANKGKKGPNSGPIDPPTFANVPYGPYKQTVLDLWLAKSDKPTPILINIHGGGFQQGDKTEMNHVLWDLCVKSGVSFASVEYRLSDVATYPAQFMDCARAVQFLRANAKKYNLDKSRFACTGSSAGAGISLWIAFHDDLANPKSADPLERESTRLTCAAVNMMQCTYDPREIKKIVPGNAYDVAAIKFLYGLPRKWNWDTDKVTPELDAKLKDCAPITHLTKDAPPVYVLHFQKDNVPGNIHNANFGKYLKERMDKVGVECVCHMDSDFHGFQASSQAMFDFLKKHFDAAPGAMGKQ